MNPIGIMQGRLSPPAPHRLQAFPCLSWEEEFANAQALEVDCIEWLFEADEYERNPLWTDTGLQRINDLQRRHDVRVYSVCADYFMTNMLFRTSTDEQAKNIAILKRLIQQATQIGVTVILLPVLEVAEIRTSLETDQLVDSIQTCLPIAEAHGVRLGLEAELPGELYCELIDRFAHSNVCAYYDLGNNAAKGHDLGRDIRLLGPLISGVHVKDRCRDGSSVLLGFGDTDFAEAFAALHDIMYEGPLVLQTSFGQDYLGDARRNLEFIKSQWLK